MPLARLLAIDREASVPNPCIERHLAWTDDRKRHGAWAVRSRPLLTQRCGL